MQHGPVRGRRRDPTAARTRGVAHPNTLFPTGLDRVRFGHFRKSCCPYLHEHSPTPFASLKEMDPMTRRKNKHPTDLLAEQLAADTSRDTVTAQGGTRRC